MSAVGDAFQVHAAELYRRCLDEKLFPSEFKAELARRRVAQMAAPAGTPDIAAAPDLPPTPSPSGALYMVVDLSRGAKAKKYRVTYLDAVPQGGWTDEYKTTKLVLRRIEPGTFQMGEPGKSVETTLTKPYYIGVFEVTQKQYELVKGANPSVERGAAKTVDMFKGDRRPVHTLGWVEIRGGGVVNNWPKMRKVAPDSFAGRLQARTKLGFDLPTEAQWEYACRAGTTSEYNNGGDTEDDLRKVGRYLLNQAGRGEHDTDESVKRHTPDNAGGCASYHTVVGSYLPNAWGLYDMHGNVREWCLDWNKEDKGRLSGGPDPLGPLQGTARVMCGGAWNSTHDDCMAWRRWSCGITTWFSHCGFRLACPAESVNK